MKPQERESFRWKRTLAKRAPSLNVNSFYSLKKKILILGIFKRGVMAGALVLLMLNRLQMLKESRGQECKRPDRERRGRGGKSKHETPLHPQDPTGDVTNRRVTSVSFFQHKVIPLFPPLSSQFVSKPFLAEFLTSNLLPLINTISAKFTISVANSVLIWSSSLCFIPFQHSSLCSWPLLSVLHTS